jgi:phage recombination protein Bet
MMTSQRADTSVKFSDEQKRVILETCCGGASQAEAVALIAIAEERGLNPVLGECYFVQRYDSQTKRQKWAVQVAIDSLRIKAEQTGNYAGQDEPEYEYATNGDLMLARVRVWRKDWPRPMVGVARWSEYVQTTRDGNPTRFWTQMPHNQLAKCAESLALRKAFPAVLAKLYTPEEMGQADNVVPPRAFAVVQSAPALPARPSVVGDFEELKTRIASASTVAQLNACAKDAARLVRADVLSDGELAAVKKLGAERRLEIGAPKPPASEPRMVDVDPSGYAADEAEAEALASSGDE